MEWQEFVNATIRPYRDAFQRILQPGIRIDAVRFSGSDQRLDNRGTFPRSLGPYKHPILASDRNRSNGSFNRGIVDGQITTGRLARQGLSLIHI